MFSPRLLLASALLAAMALSRTHAAEPPNVLLVLVDDLGYSDLGCYGGEIPTPNIDGLANSGLRYTGMTNSARCCPSRASLLTGLQPGQAGIPNFQGSLNAECVTLAEVLGGAGYQTYGVGKWHVGEGSALPTNRGFQEFYGFPGGHSQDQWQPENYVRLPEGKTSELKYPAGKFYATDVFTDYALEFIHQAEKQKNKPWFMYLAYSSPHFPIQAPVESVTPFLDTYRKGWDVLREARFERMKKLGLADGPGWKLTDRAIVPVDKDAITNGYSGKPNPAWNSLPADRREDLAHRMAIYAAMVKHVDDGIGRIVAQLKASGDYTNTVTMFLSDNGACYEWGPFGFDGKSRAGKTTLHTGEALETMGGPGPEMAYGSAWANLCNTPFRLYKHFTHQGGIASPFIVSWPGVITPRPEWIRDPAHVMDIMPTVVDLAHATYPASYHGNKITPMQGVSLAPTFKAGGSLAPRALCYNHQGSKAIHKGKWKLIFEKQFPDMKGWQLYDMEADPCETTNVAQQNPEIAQALEKEWMAWAEKSGVLGKPNKGNGGGKKKNTENDEG